MDPSVQKVWGLPELRENIFTYLLFDENQVPKISTYKIFRLVCKPWLETTNRLIYQNLGNLNDPYRDRRQYVPVRFNYDKIPDFIELVRKSCLKTAPALPFELVLSSYEDKLKDGEHHNAIITLLNNFSDGLLKLNLRSPCNLGNLHLPNLQVLTATITYKETGKGFEKDIQTILDGAQDSLHSHTFFISRLSPDDRVLPVRLPEKLHSLAIRYECDISHLEMLLSYNLNSILNLQHLHVSVETQTTFSNPELLRQFLSNCPHIKRIYFGRHSRPCFGKSTVICQFPLPETLNQMESMELDLFGNVDKPKEALLLLETSARYPKWKELKIRGFTKEDLNTWTTYYPSQNLKRLRYGFERMYEKYGDEEQISLGLNILHLEQIHLAYPNLTYLEIAVENQKSLEYIFKEMTNLKTLHIKYYEKSYINWDAVLIGCPMTEIKKLREDYKKDAGSVTFVSTGELPSIRNMKDLQTLLLYSEDSYVYPPDEYWLSDVAFLYAFLRMESLLKLKIWLRSRISENIQQLWTSRPSRSIEVGKYFTHNYSCGFPK